MFETKRDVRLFLSLLARAVRRYRIRVLAFSVMTTHFHLLVESVLGNLSSAMDFVESCYVRKFNFWRERDGALFRSRFWSRVVEDQVDASAVVRYLDANAPRAGVVRLPHEYLWSSAYHYARRQGPAWLHRDWLEARISAWAGRPFHPDDYVRWTARTPPGAVWVAERRATGHRLHLSRLDTLIGQPASALRHWLRRCAILADGRRHLECVLDPESVRTAVSECAALLLRDPEHGRRILEAGLLRRTCGLTYKEAAIWLGCGTATAKQLAHEFGKALADDDEFAVVAAHAFERALDLAYSGL